MTLGGENQFPATHRSVVDLLQSITASERAQSVDLVTRAYHAPIRQHLRLRWRLSDEDSDDLTQEFFVLALAKGYFEAYDSRKARFRTYVRMCVDRMVATRRRDQQRLKRGGGTVTVGLEEESLGLPSDAPTAEERFDREWVKSLFTLAVEELEAECRKRGRFLHFQVFSRYDLNESDEALSYARVAGELGIGAKDVANHLAAARRELRRILHELLRRLTATEDEYRDEVRHILGVEP